MKISYSTRTKIMNSFFITLTMCGAIFIWDRYQSQKQKVEELAPSEKISVYLDMKLDLNGQLSTSPQLVCVMGKKSSFVYTFKKFGIYITARPFQTRSMDKQTLLIEYEFSKVDRTTKAKEILSTVIIKARNRERATVFVEESKSLSETLKLSVVPYFGPREELAFH